MAVKIIKETEKLVNKGKLDEAVTIINKALNINPYHAPGWELKGRLLSSLGKDSEAQVCYQKGKKYGMNALTMLAGQKKVPRNPDQINIKLIEPIGYIHDEESWTQHAVSLVALYKFEEALVCYNKALKFNPNYIPAKENKDFLLKLTGWKD